MHLRRPISTLWLILLAHIAAGCMFGLSTPVFDVSDELRHMAMIEHYAQGRGLPVQDPARHEFFEQEGSQPPLYYLALAGAAQAFDLSDFREIAQINPHGRLGRADATDNRNQMLAAPASAWPWHKTALFVHFFRLMGTLCGAVSVLAVWGCAWELGLSWQPTRARPIANLAATLTAFNPMFVFINASITNDVFVILFGSLALWMGLRVLRTGLSGRAALGLGTGLGLALLSKSSAFAIAIVLGLALAFHTWMQARARTANLPEAAARLATIVLSAATLSGWWYVRNWLRYGEFTGTRMMALMAGPRQPPLNHYTDLIAEWDGFFKAYWGLFGAVNLPMHEFVYTALTLLTIAAGFGLLLALFRGGLFHSAKRNGMEALPALTLFAAFGLAFVALCVWTSMTLASQGRLLFPVIAATSSLMAVGLNCLCEVIFDGWDSFRGAPLPSGQGGLRGNSLFCWGLAVALGALTLIVPFVYIAPAYANPLRLAASAPLTLTRKVELRFGDAIRWVGYSVAEPSKRLRPGDRFEVIFYWQALKPIHQNYSLFVKLFDREKREVARLDATPGGGMWQTSLWQADEIIADRYQLVLDREVALPGALWLDAGFYEFESKINLPSFDLAGAPTGRQRFEVAGVSHTSRGVPLAALSTDFAAFGSGVDGSPAGNVSVLIGLVPERNLIELTTVWSVHAPLDDDYTMFAQVLDQNGMVVGQKDGRHADEGYAAQWWQAGDVITDTRGITLNNTVDLGRDAARLRVVFGLYQQNNEARAAMYRPGFVRAQDDALVIALTDEKNK